MGHIITAVNYKIKPWQYSPEMFEVFVGAGAVEPAIIKDEEHKQALLKQSLLEGVGKEEDLIIQVPCSIKKTFEINIRLALQNHCGVPTNIQGRFMNNLKPLYDSFVIDSPPIFSSEVLEASTADDTELIEFLLPENIEFSYRPHSVFMDLSVQHDTGTLCCYRYDGNQDGVDIHSKVFLLKNRAACISISNKDIKGTKSGN